MKNLRKIISLVVLVSFATSLIVAPAGAASAGGLGTPSLITSLPREPNWSVAGFQPPVLLGLKIHPENPLLFDFIVDQGAANLSPDELKSETEKLVKYFLAALTIPDKESWVNLSPSEKDRIIPDVLGQTLMGKAMLEQDYLLKQFASSLTNPEETLGQEFWSKVRAQVGNENVQTSTLNKVWIIPAKAEVLESNGIVLVGEKKLKVMMDEEHEKRLSSDPGSEIFRSTILPKIDQEVNEGKNFAEVRQIYNSVILATWYKKALKDSLLGKVYADKGKVAGVETDDKEMKQRIYDQYLAAFKKGVYNLIKEETDTVTGETIPRKYFSGGLTIVPAEVAVRKVASAAVETELSKTTSTISIATVQGTETQERNAVQDKVSASSGVNNDKQLQLQKENDFYKAVMTYRRERLQRSYETLIWWGQHKGFYKPHTYIDDLAATIAITPDMKGADLALIKEFLGLANKLISLATSNTASDRSNMAALLTSNYNRFSAFYDLFFHEEVTNPIGIIGQSGLSSRVSGARFHSDLVAKTDTILTDAQKAEFTARYKPEYPDLWDFGVLAELAKKQDRIKTGSGKIWDYLIQFTHEKIAEAQTLSAQGTSAALVSNAARWRAERMHVNLAADELLTILENTLPAMKGVTYPEMSAFHILLRELVYEGYYIYLQDESVEAVVDRALDISVMKNLTTLKIPGRSPMNLKEVKEQLERLGFEPNGRPGEDLVDPLTRVLKKLAASSASSALESETAINSVVGEIEGMLEATKDFKEESELDLARLSRAGRESYAAFRLRRAQWPVDLKVLREDVENYKVSQRGDLLPGILKTAEDLANEIRGYWEVRDKPQSWSYWTGGRGVAAGRAELMSTDKEIGRYEFLFALRHGLISQGDLVIVNVNDDAPSRLRRPERFGTIEKMVAPGLIELWGADKVNLDLDGVITFENDPAPGFALRDVISARLVPSASSGVTKQTQREQMIGQALSDREAIVNAFQNRLFQVGDQVDIRFTRFDASGNPTIKTFIDMITAVNPMQFKGVINENTIIRVGASGTRLENVQSIALVALSNSSIVASSGVSLKDYLISKLSSKTFFTAYDLRSIATDRMKAVWAALNEYPDVVDTKYRALYGGDVRSDFLGTVRVGAEEMVLTRFLGLKRNELDSEAARTLVGPFYVRGNQLDKTFMNFENFENLSDKITVAASSGVVLAKAENIKIADSRGIHSRPAVELVKLKEKFPQFDIFVSYKARLDIRKVKLEGFLRMLGLQIPQTTVTVELELAEGYEDSPDIRSKSEEALKALKTILLTDFSGSDRSPFAASSSVNNGQQEYGGIDFDPTNMNLQIKRDGKGVPLPLPQQNLEQINIDGLFPVIINIVPVNSQTLPVFLGRADAALPLGRS